MNITATVTRPVRAGHRPPRLCCASPLLLALLCSAGWAADPLPSTALPAFGRVTVGQASTPVKVENRLTVTQNSPRAAIEWSSFDVGSGMEVRFDQQKPDWVMLNRVTSGGASRIEGRVSGNGQVFLLNPSGVLFGNGAQVQVGGLVASSLSMADGDFAAGRYTFSGSATRGAVVNDGRLEATSGSVVLLAPQVAHGSGATIVAAKGRVSLATGTSATLDFTGDRLITFAVDGGVLDAVAPAAAVSEAVVKLSAKAAEVLTNTVVSAGAVEATVAVLRQGVVVLEPASPLRVDGAVQARAIEVQGRVLTGAGSLTAVADAGARISVDADLAAWKGSMEARGAGSAVAVNTSVALLLDKGSRVAATGTPQSPGQVTIGSKGAALLDGEVAADGFNPAGDGRGGTVTLGAPALVLLGNARVHADGQAAGGLVHLDGSAAPNGRPLQSVAPTAVLSATADNGTPGELLIDRERIVVSDSVIETPCCDLPSTIDKDRVSAGLVERVVTGGTSVRLQATSDLDVDAPLHLVTDGPAGALTLRAGRGVAIGQPVTGSASDITVAGDDPVAAGGPGTSGGGPGWITMNGDGSEGRIDAGSGRVSIELKRPGGTVQLSDVTAASIDVRSRATAGNEGHDLFLDGTLRATGEGDSLVVSGERLAISPSITEPFVVAPGGRWLAYAGSPDGNDLGGLASPGNLFGRTRDADPPASIDPAFGNRLVYRVSPTLHVTAQDQTRLYGDANAVFGYGVTGFVAGDTAASTLTGSLGSSATERSHVGSYAIGQGSLADRLGYTLDVTPATLTVQPRPVTIAADDVTRPYGGGVPASASGRVVAGQPVFGDQVGAVQGGSALPSTAHAGEQAPWTPTGWSVAGGDNQSTTADYAPTFVGSTLTVTPRPVTIRVSDRTRLYGDPNPTAGEGVVTAGSLVFGDAVGPLPLATPLAPTAHAGETAALNATTWQPAGGSNGSRAGDYQTTLVPGTIEVRPRPVTLTVQDQTRPYGDANPQQGTVLSNDGGLVFGDGVGSLPLTTTLPAAAHAGDSAPLLASGWTPTGGTNASLPGDYAFSLVPGTLTVQPRPLTLTVQDQARAYGNPNPARGEVRADEGGLVFGDRIGTVDVATALAPQAHAGTSAPLTLAGYAIDSTTSRPGDYAVTAVAGTLAVTPRPVVLTVEDQARSFGAANPVAGSVRADAEAMVYGDRVDGVAVQTTLGREAGLGASAALDGSNPRLVAGPNGSLPSDYAFSVAPGRITVDSLPPGTPQAGEIAPVVAPPAPRVPPAVPADGAGPGLVAVADPGDATLAYAPERFLAAAEARHEQFSSLFRTSIDVLRQDPTAADLPPCPDGVKDRRGADEDLCMPVAAAQLAVNEPDAGTELGDPAADTRAAEAAPAAPATHAAIRRKQAYLIGISAYRGEIPRLRTPLADVGAIGRELEQRFGYEVATVKNATKRDIVALFRRIAEETTVDDSVLVYYAGHGYELDDTKAGFWIPADATVDDPASWVSNADISRFLTLIPARQIILVSDSCYSGTLAREGQVDPREVSRDRARILAGRSVVVMTSGGEEPVFDGGGEGHSIFTRSLLDSLRQAGQWEPGSTVYQDVRQRVESRYPQYPRYGAASSAGHRAGGDYVFEPTPGPN